jgi:two-component system, NtrC family, sensor histidine kinase PilS
LLAEDATTATHKQLTRMIGHNVERLKRIVDDVMDVASNAHDAAAQNLDVNTWVTHLCNEWSQTQALPPGVLQVHTSNQEVQVVFDAEHLTRIMINLLDNARRHADAKSPQISVQIQVENDQNVVLSVLSNGQPIAPDVEKYLFEPFFSTRSKGTGLGLYICKELCDRYGAHIDYRRDHNQALIRNEFFLTLRRHV